MPPLFRCLAAGLAILLVAVAARGAEENRPATRDYVLQPGDVIRVQVFQEPDLDRELRVSQDGELMFPLIGRVVAKDRTVAQLEELVRAAYDHDFLVNPQVNIAVLHYRTRSVNVLGMVNQPQAVELPPEQTFTVLDAISHAGGFNRLADRRHVRLTRTFAGGRTENYVINADELIDGSIKQTWIVQADDVIFVPERVL